jgi:hypothetical protein
VNEVKIDLVASIKLSQAKIKYPIVNSVMPHEYFNQGAGDMLCYFLGYNTRNYSEKKTFSDIFART